MTYATNNLVSSVTSIPATTRTIPRSIHPKTLAAVGAAPLYAVLTPMAYNTSTNKWVIWANGGANGTGTIGGFLNEPAQTDASNDVIANMVMSGQIHVDDVPVPSGQTLANLKIALADGMRSRGFDIVGMIETTVGVH